MPKMRRSESESSESEYSDSDLELQEAFAAKKLKPGLNRVLEKTTKVFANNVPEMTRKLTGIKLKLPWIETLDLTNKPAPLAPELAAQVQDQAASRMNAMANNAKLPQFSISDDPVLNDFQRELMFHRQAQAAILEGISRLKNMGIATKRPDDYFAEMAKTDDHMQKVRQMLMKKQAVEEQRERVREMRIQRKEGKAIQIQARQQKQKEKKEMLNQVKKVRKGLSKNLDFLDGKRKSKKALEKEKFKSQKYGFGGKKRGSKRNTKDSSADIDGEKSRNRVPGGGARNGKIKNMRPGKNRRQKMKSKGRK